MSTMGTDQRSFAVVTGASSGIGYELAKQFAQNGFDVLIVAEDEAIKDAERDLSILGAKVESLRANLASYEGVEQVYQKIQSLGKPVDALALNAGVAVSGRFATETDLGDELSLIQLNVMAPVHLAKRVVRDMVNRGKGRILFTSSIASTMPGPYFAAYAASKAFVQSFAAAIRAELKDTGVIVTSLMPGPTDTNFFQRAGMENTPVGESEHKDDPAQVAKQGFEALMAGKDHVVAGSILNKLQAAAAKVLPEGIRAHLQGNQVKPDESKKDDAA